MTERAFNQQEIKVVIKIRCLRPFSFCYILFASATDTRSVLLPMLLFVSDYAGVLTDTTVCSTARRMEIDWIKTIDKRKVNPSSPSSLIGRLKDLVQVRAPDSFTVLSAKIGERVRCFFYLDRLASR